MCVVASGQAKPVLLGARSRPPKLSPAARVADFLLPRPQWMTLCAGAVDAGIRSTCSVARRPDDRELLGFPSDSMAARGSRLWCGGLRPAAMVYWCCGLGSGRKPWAHGLARRAAICAMHHVGNEQGPCRPRISSKPLIRWLRAPCDLDPSTPSSPLHCGRLKCLHHHGTVPKRPWLLVGGNGQSSQISARGALPLRAMAI